MLILLAALLVIGVAAFFLIRQFLLPQNISAAPGTDKAIVQTASGSIRGSIEGETYQYLGIPYAQAKERFVPAEAVEP